MTEKQKKVLEAIWEKLLQDDEPVQLSPAYSEKIEEKIQEAEARINYVQRFENNPDELKERLHITDIMSNLENFDQLLLLILCTKPIFMFEEVVEYCYEKILIRMYEKLSEEREFTEETVRSVISVELERLVSIGLIKKHKASSKEAKRKIFFYSVTEGVINSMVQKNLNTTSTTVNDEFTRRTELSEFVEKEIERIGKFPNDFNNIFSEFEVGALRLGITPFMPPRTTDKSPCEPCECDLENLYEEYKEEFEQNTGVVKMPAPPAHSNPFQDLLDDLDKAFDNGIDRKTNDSETVSEGNYVEDTENPTEEKSSTEEIRVMQEEIDRLNSDKETLIKERDFAEKCLTRLLFIINRHKEEKGLSVEQIEKYIFSANGEFIFFDCLNSCNDTAENEVVNSITSVVNSWLKCTDYKRYDNYNTETAKELECDE